MLSVVTFDAVAAVALGAANAALPFSWLLLPLHVPCLRAESRHVYQPFESKGGFAEFALAAEVLDPDKGFYKNDCLKIRVQVRVEVGHSNKLLL